MGLEPTTPCLQSRCSSQLSYAPGGALIVPAIAAGDELSGRDAAPCGGGDPDAGSHEHGGAVDRHRPLQGLEDALRDVDDGLQLRRVIDQDGELVATEPGVSPGRRQPRRRSATTAPETTAVG
jgi:hypothetical protein